MTTTNAFPNLIFKQSNMPRIDCLECGCPLKIIRIEPATRQFDLQTFGCIECDVSETFVVELDALRVVNERPPDTMGQ